MKDRPSPCKCFCTSKARSLKIFSDAFSAEAVWMWISTELASTHWFQSASFGSGVGYCMFSSHFEFLRDDCCVFTFWLTLHKLSIVDPLHWLSFDSDKRKTCSVRAMVVQVLISSWCYTYTKSIWTAGCHWNWKENLYDRLMHFFSISVYLVQFFCIGNSFCWRVCWNFPRPG